MTHCPSLDQELWPLALEQLRLDVRSRQQAFGGRLLTLPGALGVADASVRIPCWVHDPAADLGEVIAACRTSRTPMPIHILADHPDQQLVLDAGWVLAEHLTEMLLLEPPPPRDAPPGVAIEPVRVPGGLEEFYAAMARGFEAHPHEPEQWLPRAAIATDGVQLLVARDDAGAVVGTAGLRPRGDGANLYAISVPPQHRRQGIGTALTAAAAQAAFAQGAALVHLHASPAGYPIYERAGFRVVGSWALYDPPD